MNELADAFKKISDREQPSVSASVLTYSEKRLYERAVKIYSSLPDAAEIRAAFHCRKISAEKIHAALKEVLTETS